ncbi:MAG: lipopolysaccharide biosynthesis protein [Candidatus Latescibacteria bacterium]|jgi:O-antigen/teichoic acid export membrane protein|nr:lipopolysaccharide biosynthesis protein [Candidatus Latescibacterota bacterium]
MSTNKLYLNSVTTVSSKFFSALVQILCLPILIKVYGKGEYGLIVIALFLNTFIAILQFGIPSGMLKFVAEWIAKGQKQEMVKATRTVTTFYLVIALINVVIILSIRYFFIDMFKIHPEQMVILGSLLIVTAVASFVSIPVGLIDQLLSGVQEIAFIAKMQMIKNAIYASLVFYIFLNPQKLSIVEYYILNVIIMFSMVPVKLMRWTRHSSLRVFIPGWNFKSIFPLLKYCSSLLVLAVFIILADKLTPMIMSVRVSANAAEHMTDYQIINNVRMFIMMIGSSFFMTLVPYVSHEFAKGNTHVYKKTIQHATKPVWAVGALIGFGVILLSKELLTIYVGVENLYLHKWLILLVASVIYNLYNPCISSVIIASGRTLPLVAISGCACLVSLVACWMLCPVTAIGAIVIANVIYTGIAFLGSHFYYLPKCFGVSPIEQIMKVLLPPVLSGLIMLFSVRYLLDWLDIASPFVTIVIGAITGFVVYSLVILTIYIKPVDAMLLINKVKKNRTDN